MSTKTTTRGSKKGAVKNRNGASGVSTSAPEPIRPEEVSPATHALLARSLAKLADEHKRKAAGVSPEPGSYTLEATIRLSDALVVQRGSEDKDVEKPTVAMGDLLLALIYRDTGGNIDRTVECLEIAMRLYADQIRAGGKATLDRISKILDDAFLDCARKSDLVETKVQPGRAGAVQSNPDAALLHLIAE